MKRTVGLLVSAAAILLSSCGTTARYASSDNGQRFQDGIYGTTPSFRTKAEKELGKQAADALIEKTQASEIYLFGDKKDTVIIPDNMAAKIKLDQKKLANPAAYPDSVYDAALSKIKKGELEGGKVPTMTIIIKCTDEASYKNMVDALDEMTICSIGTYVIDKINPQDAELLAKRGIK